MIGYCGLVFGGTGFGPAPADEPEIAFELARATHGRGYATEAAAAVVSWAATVGHARLWATVRDWNAPSLRTLAKLGFVATGDVEADPEHGDSLLLVRDGRPGQVPA